MKKLPDAEIEIQTVNEDGFPLYIYVDINFIEDETPDSYRGSQTFWTYYIVKVKATLYFLGDTCDYTDRLDKYLYEEINEACLKEVHSFQRGIA